MTQQQHTDRAILIIWWWNKGLDKIAEGKFYDVWTAPNGGVLLRADQHQKGMAWTELVDWIGGYQNVLVLLHESHGYRETDVASLHTLENTRQGHLRARLFGGGKGPLYVGDNE